VVTVLLLILNAELPPILARVYVLQVNGAAQVYHQIMAPPSAAATQAQHVEMASASQAMGKAVAHALKTVPAPHLPQNLVVTARAVPTLVNHVARALKIVILVQIPVAMAHVGQLKTQETAH